MDRRTFLKAFTALWLSPWLKLTPQTTTPVAFIKTDDRAVGVKKALDLLGFSGVKGKKLFLKPNFNSADPAPGSTHPDTLRTLIQALQTLGAERITVGDRSGMGNTRAVMEQLGLFRMAQELDFEVMVFDQRRLPARFGGAGWSGSLCRRRA